MKFELKYVFTNISSLLPLTNVFHQNVVDLDIKALDQHIELNYHNVLNLAYMSYNVYLDESNKEWLDIDLNKTVNMSLNNDSVRAYLFSNLDNTINVVSIKGTSIYFSSTNKDEISAQSTVTKDKYNDNLFLSCCFYKQSKLFQGSCACNNVHLSQRVFMSTKNTCCQQCYKETRNLDDNYLKIMQNITQNIKNLVNFDKSLVVFTGHSLGGVVATMMGILYNKMVVTFEAPGERHYVDLIGIPYSIEQEQRIFHFGHNADTIFTGKCRGTMSLCYLGGYIIETKCHIGNVCEYDSVTKLGMKESIFTHKLKYVIDNVITKWNDTLPVCEKKPCKDCKEWIFTS